MAKTNIGLVEYAKAQLGLPYWYGTFGNIGTEALHTAKAKQYPNYYKRSKYKQGWAHQYGMRVHDCVGLIKGYLWSDTAVSKPKYNAAQDYSANGMRSVCKEQGKIATMPEIKGLLVFFNGHIGVYIGNGEVIEAMGHNEGVVKTKLKNRPWKYWGKCPFITYVQEKAPAVKTEQYKVICYSLTIRNGAGTTHKINGYLKKGDTVTITQINNNWGKLANGKGWVSVKPKYMKKV